MVVANIKLITAAKVKCYSWRRIYWIMFAQQLRAVSSYFQRLLYVIGLHSLILSKVCIIVTHCTIHTHLVDIINSFIVKLNSLIFLLLYSTTQLYV